MNMTNTTTPLLEADVLSITAECLFVSPLQPSQQPTHDQVWYEIGESLRRCGTSDAVSAVMAGEFGDHPVEAFDRMAWSIKMMRECWGIA